MAVPKVIHKWDLGNELEDRRFYIKQTNVKILSVLVQNKSIVLYTLGEPSEKESTLDVQVWFTGDINQTTIDTDIVYKLNFIASVQIDLYVFHVFAAIGTNKV